MNININLSEEKKDSDCNEKESVLRLDFRKELDGVWGELETLHMKIEELRQELRNHTKD